MTWFYGGMIATVKIKRGNKIKRFGINDNCTTECKIGGMAKTHKMKSNAGMAYSGT